MLDTAFGLALHYNWKHYLQVEAIVMFGVLCGFCGNANHSSSDGIIATNGTNETQAVDFTFPWLMNSDAGSCTEDCGGVSCPVCTCSLTNVFLTIKGSSYMIGEYKTGKPLPSPVSFTISFFLNDTIVCCLSELWHVL